MQYLKLATLLLATSVLHSAPEQTNMTLKERIVDVKDRTVSKLSAMLVLWSGASQEDQKKRLEYYTNLCENKKTRRVLKNWDMYIKRWYPWIVEGKMPIKNPDGRISDQKLLDYVVIVEELKKGEPLTQEEREEVCRRALEEVERYREAKGIR